MLEFGSDINLKLPTAGRRVNIDDGLDTAFDQAVLTVGMHDASALHHAANHGHVEVCRLILESDVFTETDSTSSSACTDEDREVEVTALHVAALNSHSEVCCLILQSPAFTKVDAELREYYSGRTALAIACMKGLPEVVQALLNHPRCKCVNAFVDDYDTTLLMLAATRKTWGNAECCRWIMADPRFTKYDTRSCAGGAIAGGTAYEFANRAGLSEIARELFIRCYPNEVGNGKGYGKGKAQSRVPGMVLHDSSKPAQPVSTLSAREKDFLKVAKTLREIKKLEDLGQTGKTLDSSQQSKVAKKAAVIEDVRRCANALGLACDLREKNADIITMISNSG